MPTSYELRRVELTQQEFDDLAGRRDPGSAYFIDGKLAAFGESLAVVGGVSVSRVFATGRAQGLGQSSTGLSASNIDRLGGRYVFKAGKRGVKNPRYVFSSHYLAPAYSTAPNPFTVAAGMERNSQFTRALFGGAQTRVINPTDGLIETDAIAPFLAADESIFVRTEVSMAVGQQCPVGYLRYPSNNTVETIPQSSGQPSQLAAIGVMAIAGSYTHGGFGFGPLAVVGDVDSYTPSALVFGDSIADGNGYHTAGNDGSMGYIALGLYNAGVGHCKATRGSNRAAYSTPVLSPNQFALCRYATHLIGNLGTNDIFAGRTLAQLQADLLDIWAGAKAVQAQIKIHWQLLLPRTTSTDSWATTANQTPIAGFEVGGIRDQLNAWLYAKVADGTIAGIINPLPDCESPTTPGVWGPALTTDGVHPASATHITMADRVQSVADSWRTAP